ISHLPLHHPAHHQHLPSFPTRRSSDLWPISALVFPSATHAKTCLSRRVSRAYASASFDRCITVPPSSVGSERPQPPWLAVRDDRSEEHTSELQSRFDLVCRLLLEKKN